MRITEIECKLQSLPKPDRKYLTPSEIASLIAASSRLSRNPVRDKAILTVMFRHGLRASEVALLQWIDISFQDLTIFIRRKKGSQSLMNPLYPEEAVLLKKLKKKTFNPYVFISESGNPIDDNTIRYLIHKANVLSGIPFRINAHMIRHTTAQILADNGNDVFLIKQQLGHSDIRNTMIYVNNSPTRLRQMKW